MTIWINKYNELLQINDNLRQTMESINLSDNSGEDKSDIEASGSEYYEEYSDEEEEKPQKQSSGKNENGGGWFW